MSDKMLTSSSGISVRFVSSFLRLEGGGGKTLTMTMTPWNLTHGQSSKWLFCGQNLWLNQRFTISTIGKFVFWPWSGSKRVFLWLNFAVKF